MRVDRVDGFGGFTGGLTAGVLAVTGNVLMLRQS
jgi:hypothetical protein